MVLKGNLSPDPSNRPDENFQPSDVGILALTSSDSEEEEISYEGYEVLPQDFIENNIVQNDSDSEDGYSETNDNIDEQNLGADNPREISGFSQAVKCELSELWNSSNRPTDIVIDSTKEEQIKNAMAGFKLPLSSIPPWAKQIPEEEWKQQLINKVSLSNKVSAV